MPSSPPVLLPSTPMASRTLMRRPANVESIHTAPTNLPSHPPPMDSAAIYTSPVDLLLAASQLLQPHSHLVTTQDESPGQQIPSPATHDVPLQSSYPRNESGQQKQSAGFESSSAKEISADTDKLYLLPSESRQEDSNHCCAHMVPSGTSQSDAQNRDSRVAVNAVASNADTEDQISLSLRPLPLRRRKMPREGPDARIAPHEECAVSKALQNTDRQPGQPIFYPYIGTTFNSCEEAWEYYNLYSWEIGFGIRYGRRSTNKKDYRTRQDIMCSCEGFDRSMNSSSQRTNCKAMIRLLRTSDHGWYISKVIDSHNHEFSVGYAEKKQWNSHGSIDPTTRDFIKKLRENNVSIGKVCSILGVSGGAYGAPLRKQSVRSACAKIVRENMRDDIGKTMRILEDMKTKDPGMAVRYQLDSKGRIKSMLWCSGKNRLDYEMFGDAITFDTTYKTNLYSMPFGLFVGVNSHFQSVIFGGVLLTSEKTSDFTWAFTSFVEVMGGKLPKTILTDQCSAMAKAIRLNLVGVKHRWCRWHVLKDAKKRLGKVYSKHKGFKREFNALITYEVCADKFESRWQTLMVKYGLDNNKFLKRLYKQRHKWAKPYFMDVFCAGMTSTQRSESANHMLKGHIQKSAPMHMFVSKFNEFLADRTDQDGTEQHATKMVNRKLRVGVPIERHAYSLYTRAMYERFYDELFESGSLTIKEVEAPNKYKVLESSSAEHTSMEYTVTLPDADTASCNCGLFNHVGILCKHALKVLVHLDYHEIPKNNILKRWTRAATVSENIIPFTDKCTSDGAAQMMKRTLLMKTLELVSGNAEISEQAFIDAMNALSSATSNNVGTVNGRPTDIVNHADGGQNVPLGCPERTYKGGRPQGTGLNSWLTRQRKQARKSIVDNDPIEATWPDEERPPNKKTKRLADL